MCVRLGESGGARDVRDRTRRSPVHWRAPGPRAATPAHAGGPQPEDCPHILRQSAGQSAYCVNVSRHRVI